MLTVDQAPDLEQIRQDTPLFARYIYLDAAAASPPPRPVVQAMVTYLERLAEWGPYLPRFRAETYDRVEDIRRKAAEFIGASPEEVAFTRNGTEGINLVAEGLTWQEGDEIVLLDIEFHSNYVPWLRLAKEKGVRLRVIKTSEDGLVSPDMVLSAISHRTRLVTLTHVSNALGTVQPAEAIGVALKQEYPQVLYLVNASQSLGLLPIRVQDLRCDFLTAPSRKWLRGPEGSGLLYVRRELIESLRPPFVGWGGTEWLAGRDEFRYAGTAKRFQAGLPDIPAILGLGAALEYAQQLRIEWIADRVRRLTEYGYELLQQIPGVRVLGPRVPRDRIGMIPFTVQGVAPRHVVSVLEEHGVIVEAGTFMAHVALAKYGVAEVIRISPHYYNTEADLEKAASFIRGLVGKGVQS